MGAPGITLASALSMVCECRRVASALSSGVKVGSASSHPEGSSPLMIVFSSAASCAPARRVVRVSGISGLQGTRAQRVKKVFGIAGCSSTPKCMQT